MATTTTIYPTDDTHIREPNPTTNYGTGIYLPMGEWSGGRRHALLQFDVSSFAKPSDIVSANFSLTAISSSGGSTRNMTLARLDQSFVDTSATWNTYNGVDTWVTAGAEDNAATDQPTYTIQVGTTTNQTVDIKSLVIDAINKRAGVLLLVIFLSSGASSYTTFGSTDNASTPNKPSLAVTVANRIEWSGDTNTDVTDSGNWDKGVAPTANDIAMFISNGEYAPVRNTLTCHKCYIGKNYSQDVGETADYLTIVADEVYADTKAQLYLHITADEFSIRGSKDIVDGCVLDGTITSVYIMNCNSEVKIKGTATISNIYIMSGNRLNPATNTSTGIVSQVIIEDGSDDSNIHCEGRFNVTDNGENDDISLYGGGKYVLNNTTESAGIENLTIASGSVCYFNSKEIQTALTMYGGTFTVEDNFHDQLDLPPTIINFGGFMDFDNGLDSVNATAFTGTTATMYNSTLSLGKTITMSLSG